jgi:hypothetical protein
VCTQWYGTIYSALVHWDHRHAVSELLFGWTSRVKPICARYSLVTSSWPSIQKFICSVIESYIWNPTSLFALEPPSCSHLELCLFSNKLPGYQENSGTVGKSGNWYIDFHWHQMIRDDFCIGRPLHTFCTCEFWNLLWWSLMEHTWE